MTTSKNAHRRKSRHRIYADLMRIEAQFLTHVAKILREDKLTQTEAARLFAISQPKLSKILIHKTPRRRRRGTVSIVFP